MLDRCAQAAVAVPLHQENAAVAHCTIICPRVQPHISVEGGLVVQFRWCALYDWVLPVPSCRVPLFVCTLLILIL